MIDGRISRCPGPSRLVVEAGPLSPFLILLHMPDVDLAQWHLAKKLAEEAQIVIVIALRALADLGFVLIEPRARGIVKVHQCKISRWHDLAAGGLADGAGDVASGVAGDSG